ncbi:MAG: protein kinase, partial [Rubrobacter sp.]|nr:protein kinase [Rubrobacter sp.]
MADRAHQLFIDDRYGYVDSLGSGGMARVLLVHDTVLDRDVAIKLLHQQYAEDPEFVERFRNEAQSAAALAHPNIVSIYDLGRSRDGNYYIAMEHVPGGTLKDFLDGVERLRHDEAASLAAAVADALGAAHRSGVIHRDIKPQNVLLTDKGEAKVADFGIARAVSPTSESRTSLVLGTASYMSPEQAQGEALGPQSDLYSLGVVLYEMLTGGLPFEAENPVAMALKQVSETPRPPSEVEDSVPEGMDRLVMRLLAKRPEDRYQSADELADDLRLIRGGKDPDLPAVVAPTGDSTPGKGTVSLPTSGGIPRRRQRFPLAILGVLAALGLMAWVLSEGLREPPAASVQAEAPELAGMPLTEARDALESSGLELGQTSTDASSSAPQGEIVSQSPSAGEMLEEGSPVNVTVGSGGDNGDSGGASDNGSGGGFGEGFFGEGSPGGNAPTGPGGGGGSGGGGSGGGDNGDSGGASDNGSGGGFGEGVLG